MKLKISTTLYDEMEPAIEDAVKNRARGTPDPSDPVYLKIHEATWRKTGIMIDVDTGELAELRDRATYKIEVALENMSDEPPFWRGQLRAWRALLRQIDAKVAWQPVPGGTNQANQGRDNMRINHD
jgi:hypothetical protein